MFLRRPPLLWALLWMRFQIPQVKCFKEPLEHFI